MDKILKKEDYVIICRSVDYVIVSTFKLEETKEYLSLLGQLL